MYIYKMLGGIKVLELALELKEKESKGCDIRYRYTGVSYLVYLDGSYSTSIKKEDYEEFRMVFLNN